MYEHYISTNDQQDQNNNTTEEQTPTWPPMEKIIPVDTEIDATWALYAAGGGVALALFIGTWLTIKTNRKR